jgi:hypothetical protein
MSGVLKNPVLFHYSRGGYEDEGASWEHGGAFAYNMLINKGVLKGKEKLIINVDERRAPFPLHFASANVTFTSLEIAVEFLNELNSTKKSDWFKIYNNLLNKVRGELGNKD